MPRQRINKQNPQTVFDLLLQYSGAISSLFDFLNVNELDGIDVPEGSYFAPVVLKPQMVKQLNPNNKNTPIIGSIEGTDPYNVIATVNGAPFNVWNAGSTQNIEVIDATGLYLPIILNDNEIIIDFENEYKFFEHQTLKDSFAATPGSDIEVEVNRPYTHSVTNNPINNVPIGDNPSGEDTDVIVKANGQNFNTWQIGSTHNIILKDTNGNQLNASLNGNKIVVKNIEITFRLNGVPCGFVATPITQSETINIM